MIHVPQNRRTLLPGWGYQPFAVATIRQISRQDLKDLFQDKPELMREEEERWANTIASYIVRRTDEMGYYVKAIVHKIYDDPKSSNPLEMMAWQGGDLVYVWSIWANLDAPMPEHMISEQPKPLFGFWPRDLKMVQGRGGSYHELLDATRLSQQEKDAWNSRIIRSARAL